MQDLSLTNNSDYLDQSKYFSQEFGREAQKGMQKQKDMQREGSIKGHEAAEVMSWFKTWGSKNHKGIRRYQKAEPLKKEEEKGGGEQEA